jgi:hypothetical protein
MNPHNPKIPEVHSIAYLKFFEWYPEVRVNEKAHYIN